MFVFKMVPIPEGESVFEADLTSPNKELMEELTTEILSQPPLFQLVFNKNGNVGINDVFNVVREGYKETSDNKETNELLGKVLDALKNLGRANKQFRDSASESIPAILLPFLESVTQEGSLRIGTIVNIEGHVCFLQMQRIPSFYLPETKLSEQDKKA